MKIIKKFSQIILIASLLSSCKTSINKESPVINSDKKSNDIVNAEK